MTERANVEATSQDNRWEFDRKLLFGQSRYMKEICEDLFEMAKVLYLRITYLLSRPTLPFVADVKRETFMYTFLHTHSDIFD